MFGKRSRSRSSRRPVGRARRPSRSPSSAPAVPVLSRGERRRAPPRPSRSGRADARRRRGQEKRKSEEYYQTKSMIFGALIEAIDLAQLSRLEADAAREEIRDIVNEIIALKNVVMSIAEQEELLDDICNDVLGYGPLEPLLARDDIADIMVNGAEQDLHRGRRQDPAHQRPLPRQPAADEHLPADRQPGRPPRRRILADLRRAPARRLARQRHRAAARDRRADADDPQVQEGQAHPRPARPVRRDLAGGRDAPQDHRQGALQRRHLRRHRLRQDDAARTA